MKKQLIQENISNAVKKWSAEITLAQYVRDHLTELGDNNRSKADNVLDSLYHIATLGERDDHKIDAAEALLKIASSDQKPQNQINQQTNNFYSQDEFVLKHLNNKTS